jgi:hypothetical protein
MKTSLLITLILLTSILAFAVANPSTGKMTGHWYNVNGTRSCDMIFSEDGIFTGNIAQDGKVTWEFAGKWSLVADKLNYEYTRSSLKQVSVGTKDQDKLIEVTKNYYIIENAGGQQHKYIRVK